MVQIFLPLILLTISTVGYFVVNYYGTKRKKLEDSDSIQKQTAQEFMNIKEIKDSYLYTKDGYIMTYIQVTPISIELFSEREKENLASTLTSEVSGFEKPFKFLAVSRPVNIAPLLENYKSLLENSNNQVQKELLREEIKTLTNYALTGEVVERQFFIVLYEKYFENIERELARTKEDLMSRFRSANIFCNTLEESEIIRLCNLINNPAYIGIEEV